MSSHVAQETGVDDEGLTYFHEKTFPFPLYRDESLALYNSLGNRRLGVWEVGKLVAGWRSVKRCKEKGIPQNLKGEGLQKGGIFVFDAQGQLRAALPEITGSELDTEALLCTLQAIATEKK